MHDKVGPLKLLGQHLGVFKEKVDASPGGAWLDEAQSGPRARGEGKRVTELAAFSHRSAIAEERVRMTNAVMMPVVSAGSKTTRGQIASIDIVFDESPRERRVLRWREHAQDQPAVEHDGQGNRISGRRCASDNSSMQGRASSWTPFRF